MVPVMRARRMRGVAVAASVMLLLTGCTALFGPAHEPGSVYQLEPLQPGQRAVVDWQGRIKALDEVFSDETVVVVGTPVEQTMEPAPGLFTLTEFKVSEVLHGAVNGDRVQVVHTGPMRETHDSQHPEFVSIPKPGLEYLLMLYPREPDWEPRADYGISGPAQWVRQYPDQRFALDLHEHRMLHLEHTVPLDTTIEEFKLLIEELTA